MATAPLGVVERSGIFGVSPSESTGQRMVALRYGGDVNMIGHETVAQDSRAVLRGVPGQQIQVESAIVIAVKYLLAIVAALRDVMGNARNDDTRTTGHKSRVAHCGQVLMENASAAPFPPFFPQNVSGKTDGLFLSRETVRTGKQPQPLHGRRLPRPSGLFLKELRNPGDNLPQRGASLVDRSNEKEEQTPKYVRPHAWNHRHQVPLVDNPSYRYTDTRLLNEIPKSGVTEHWRTERNHGVSILAIEERHSGQEDGKSTPSAVSGYDQLPPFFQARQNNAQYQWTHFLDSLIEACMDSTVRCRFKPYFEIIQPFPPSN
jgi:hypothetical protein